MTYSVVELPSNIEYVNLYTLAGLVEDKSLIVTNNTSYPLYIIQSLTQPANSIEGFTVLSSETVLIHSDFNPIWIRGGTGPVFVQELTSTITPFTGVELPQSTYTNNVEFLRRIKVSSEPSLAAAVQNGLAYTISGSDVVNANDYLAMNISPAADSIIHKVTTNAGLVIDVYNQHATGVADGIFAAHNMNLNSIDTTPTEGQVYNPATVEGLSVFSGVTSIEPYVIIGFDNKASIVVKNTTGSTTTIKITVTLEEIGQRVPSFGLTASTLLLSGTEMSNFG